MARNYNQRAYIRESVAKYYAGRIAEFGSMAQGVDWKDETSQQLRHTQFLRLLERDYKASILDYGCGYGDFLSFLRSNGYSGQYWGFDIAAEMLHAAKRLHGESSNTHWIGDTRSHSSTDFTVASGVFNVKRQFSFAAWNDYVWSTVDEMDKISKKGFGFNMLSLHSDPEKRRGDLFYADPIVFLKKLVKLYGRKVALLQDYGLYEFTAIVRK